MRRTPLLLAGALAAAAFATPSANASIYCQDLGPVPGYGPVCTVRCVLTTNPQINPKDVKGTLQSLVVQCPA